MIFNNAKLLPTPDDLEEDFFVFRIVAPSSGLGGPHDAIAFYSTSIGPDESVDWPDVSHEHDVAGG
jgi:hypothetical protein